jgi:peroxiredoxin
MTIQTGDSLPEATFATMTPDGPKPMTTSEAFGGKTVALFAVPGAFTPTCHLNHLPTFLNRADDLKARGVDAIYCVSVNDPFVLGAWSEATASGEDITMLADGSGTFTKAIGMELDASGHGLGMRSKRYAMLVEDGKVSKMMVEDNPGEAVASTADALLDAMD